MSYNSSVCVGSSGDEPNCTTSVIYRGGANRISRYFGPNARIEEYDRGFSDRPTPKPVDRNTQTQGLYDTPGKRDEPEDCFKIYVKVDRNGKVLDPDKMRDISRRIEAVLGDYARFDSRATLYRKGDGEYELEVEGIFGIGADLKDHLSAVFEDRLSGTGLTVSLELYGERDPDLADEIFELDNGKGPQRRLLESALEDCPSNRYGELSPSEEKADTQVELPKAETHGISDPKEFEIPQKIIEALEGVEPSDSRSEVVASLEKLPAGEREAVLKYIRGLETKSRELELESKVDYLTGLGNRRALEEALGRELGVSKRRNHRGGSSSTSVVSIDLNNLKALNDLAGHDVGDYAIKVLGRVIRRSLRRPADSAYRVGGDEFIALLADTDRKGVEAVVKKIKSDVERVTRFYRTMLATRKERCYVQTGEGEKDLLDIIGISVGIAVTEEDISAENLLKEADTAMRKDKGTKRFNYRTLVA